MQAAATDTAPGDTASCDKFALHSTGTGLQRLGAQQLRRLRRLVQIPTAAGLGVKNKYRSTSAPTTGISFNIKSGSGTPPPLFFEMLGNTETISRRPRAAPRRPPPSTSTTRAARCWRRPDPDHISTTWQTVYRPLRDADSTLDLPTSQRHRSARRPPAACQVPGARLQSGQRAGAPVLVLPGPRLLGRQQLDGGDLRHLGRRRARSIRDRRPRGLPTASASRSRSRGRSEHPAPRRSRPAPPGKFLVDRRTSSGRPRPSPTTAPARCIRPENSNDTVSEGIGYGMLIAVNMNDKTTVRRAVVSYCAERTSPAGMLMTGLGPGAARRRQRWHRVGDGRGRGHGVRAHRGGQAVGRHLRGHRQDDDRPNLDQRHRSDGPVAVGREQLRERHRWQGDQPVLLRAGLLPGVRDHRRGSHWPGAIRSPPTSTRRSAISKVRWGPPA